MSNSMTTKDLASELNISRAAANILMQTTPGVIKLPKITGEGKHATRRMPRKVFEALLAKCSRPTKKARQ